MPSPTRFKVQQFAWGFRTYDSYTEEPVDLENEIARFDVNPSEADLICEEAAIIEVVGDDVVVTEQVAGG